MASLILLLIFMINLLPSALCEPQLPCFFIFGDSLVDNGNNNQLATLGKANYPPYGRFTNGRTTADVLAELMGFDTYIPPFATARDSNDIIKGVNYASALAGIREETGHQLGDRISLDRQLLNHNLTVSRIADLLGNDTAVKQHLSKCLYYFVIGSNDYLNNYYLPEYYPTSNIFTPEEYATVLVRRYTQQLQTLYNLFAVSHPCWPGALMGLLVRNPSMTHDKVKILVDDLNSNFADISANDLRPADLFAPGMRLHVIEYNWAVYDWRKSMST